MMGEKSVEGVVAAAPSAVNRVVAPSWFKLLSISIGFLSGQSRVSARNCRRGLQGEYM